jgi:hypothetical protein
MVWIGALVSDCVPTSGDSGVDGAVVVVDVDVAVLVGDDKVTGQQLTTSSVIESDQPSTQEQDSILVVVQLRMLPVSEL